jgi:hypothetical protein
MLDRPNYIVTTSLINQARHPIGDAAYAKACGAQLDAAGALVLAEFFSAEAIARIIEESAHREADAFYAKSTHNVYLTPPDPELDVEHPLNRQIVSSKGLIADDQVPLESSLREVYEDATFRAFLCGVLGIDELYPYADKLSSINVHFAAEGMELGWHFDNSSFAVTMLLQAPEAGGVFEYVPAVRDADSGDMAYARGGEVLDGTEPVQILDFEPGDLVLFRGRDALHRITPTEGSITRMLVVFAFNDQPGIGLSNSALMTFYGRTS